MGQGPRTWTQINQGQLGGSIWVPFHLSTESLTPLKWPQRPDIAKKTGFVKFGLGCSWRVNRPLRYLSFDNIQTQGQLGSKINVKYVSRSRICVFSLLYDNEWKSFHCLFLRWSPIKTPRKCIFRTWKVVFVITEDKQPPPPPHKHILECLNFYWALTVLFPCSFFTNQVWERGGRECLKKCHKNFIVIFLITREKIHTSRYDLICDDSRQISFSFSDSYPGLD